MDSKSYQDKALSFLAEGYNCTQSVFGALAPDLGLKRDLAFKIASAFGGGMNMGSTCGALTGAMLALGLAAGFGEYSPERKDAFSELNQELTRRFRKSIGHLDCRDILQIDSPNAAQKQSARRAPAILAARCQNCVKTATDLVVNILHELDIS